MKNEKETYQKRNFQDFSKTSIAQVRSENTILSGEVIKGKDLSFSFGRNVEKEQKKKLNFIQRIKKMVGLEEELEELLINTEEPLAIKVTFEIPKYKANSFNLTVLEGEFKAKIDPDISACGTLETENSVYSLTQNIESAGTCFTVTASNVTIDCNGHSIRYNSVGGVAYGVHSTASATTAHSYTVI